MPLSYLFFTVSAVDYFTVTDELVYIKLVKYNDLRSQASFNFLIRPS